MCNCKSTCGSKCNNEFIKIYPYGNRCRPVYNSVTVVLPTRTPCVRPCVNPCNYYYQNPCRYNIYDYNCGYGYPGCGYPPGYYGCGC